MTALHPAAAHLSALLERSEGPRALGVQLPAGYPTLGGSAAVLERAVRTAGAEFIALGFPTARPYMDGLETAQAHVTALRSGTARADVLALVRQLAPLAPVVVMTYAAPVLCYGVERWAEALAHAGAAGCQIADLPEDEAVAWHTAAITYGLHAPRMMEPAARPARLARVAHAATGWIYVPETGAVAGQGALDVPELSRRCARVRMCCAPPIVAGGTTPESAAEIAPRLDGVLLGNQLVRALLHDPGPDGADTAVHLVRRYSRALRAASPAGTSLPSQGPAPGGTS